jgi:hypothetical protein
MGAGPTRKKPKTTNTKDISRFLQFLKQTENGLISATDVKEGDDIAMRPSTWQSSPDAFFLGNVQEVYFWEESDACYTKDKANCIRDILVAGYFWSESLHAYIPEDKAAIYEIEANTAAIYGTILQMPTSDKERKQLTRDCIEFNEWSGW